MSMTKCKAAVYRRDTLRVSRGRSWSGERTSQRFTMHYVRGRCKRRATTLNGYCWQHDWRAEWGDADTCGALTP